MRVLVCGGRDFGNLPETPPPHEVSHGVWCLVDKNHSDYLKKKAEYDFVISTLSGWFTDYDDEYHMPYKDLVIIEGGAKGVDTAAAEFAVVHWTGLEEYQADWKKYGKRAGYIRNKEMLDKGKPDVVIAFPGGQGTKNMVELARKAGVPVIEVTYEPT